MSDTDPPQNQDGERQQETRAGAATATSAQGDRRGGDAGDDDGLSARTDNPEVAEPASGEQVDADEQSPDQPADAAAEDTGSSTTPTLQEQLEQRAEQLASVREKMLRVAADFDNFRKRSARDVEVAARRGAATAVKQLLPVFDNLDRAIAMLPAEDADSEGKGLFAGLQMVLKQLGDSLSKLGIERVESLGKPFDPAVHEGIQHAYSADHPAGSVMAELQPGYLMAGELLRPTLAVVSRGPEPTVEAADDAPTDTTNAAAEVQTDADTDTTAGDDHEAAEVSTDAAPADEAD